MLIIITPSLVNNSRNNFNRGYIIQSHLSCRERSDASSPTTLPNHLRMIGLSDVIVVGPTFIAGVVRRNDVDALDLFRVVRQQRLERN